MSKTNFLSKKEVLVWFFFIAAMYWLMFVWNTPQERENNEFFAINNPQMIYAKQLWRELPGSCRGSVRIEAEDLLAKNPSCFYELAELGQRYCDVRKT